MYNYYNRAIYLYRCEYILISSFTQLIEHQTNRLTPDIDK